MYRVEVQRKAEMQIDRLPPRIRNRVLTSLKNLANDPRPDGVVKLSGFERRYRIRVAKDYRVIYDLYDDRLLVLVVEVGHRREVYR